MVICRGKKDYLQKNYNYLHIINQLTGVHGMIMDFENFIIEQPKALDFIRLDNVDSGNKKESFKGTEEIIRRLRIKYDGVYVIDKLSNSNIIEIKDDNGVKYAIGWGFNAQKSDGKINNTYDAGVAVSLSKYKNKKLYLQIKQFLDGTYEVYFTYDVVSLLTLKEKRRNYDITIALDNFEDDRQVLSNTEETADNKWSLSTMKDSKYLLIAKSDLGKMADSIIEKIIM